MLRPAAQKKDTQKYFEIQQINYLFSGIILRAVLCCAVLCWCITHVL